MIEFQFLMLFSVISGKACHWKSQQPKSPDIRPWLEIILAKSGVCDHHHGTNGFWISGPEIIRINTVGSKMNPLPKAPLEATTPSRPEAFFGKIPILGWTIAHAMQNQRFHPIESAYKQILTSRDRDEALAEWSPDQRSDAARMMTLLEEELGWKPPTFIPTDPCLVAFWAHEDGLDDVAAIRRIEHEWGIEFSDEELAKLQDYDLQAFIALIKNKSQQAVSGNRR